VLSTRELTLVELAQYMWQDEVTLL
jgi:hypothetical protein